MRPLLESYILVQKCQRSREDIHNDSVRVSKASKSLYIFEQKRTMVTMNKQWFSTKRKYGKGWRPTTWQGWLMIAVALVLIVLNLIRLTLLSSHPSENSIEFIVETMLIIMATAGITVFIQSKHDDGA